MWRRWNRWGGVIGAVLAVAACGDSTAPPPPPPPEVEPFVGIWDAAVFTITSDADTSIVFDLFDDVSGQFFINIQPSGSYTAALTIGGLSRPENGLLTVSGGFVTLTPTGGTGSAAPYTFVRDDYLAIGPTPTEFDFNFDNVNEPGQLYFEVQRR